jgi:hypothetical protein
LRTVPERKEPSVVETVFITPVRRTMPPVVGSPAGVPSGALQSDFDPSLVGGVDDHPRSFLSAVFPLVAAAVWADFPGPVFADASTSSPRIPRHRA